MPLIFTGFMARIVVATLSGRTQGLLNRCFHFSSAASCSVSNCSSCSSCCIAVVVVVVAQRRYIAPHMRPCVAAVARDLPVPHTTSVSRLYYLLIATLKPQNNGPSYSNTVICTLAVDGWAVTYSEEGTGQGRSPPGPSLLYQM